MTSYFKKVIFFFSILALPYMNSLSNAMLDKEYVGSTIRIHKVSFVEEDQQGVLALTKSSATPEVVKLEDPTVSWTTYLSSPVTKISQNIEKFINFAKAHPRAATVVGLLYLTHAAAALEAVAEVTCKCVCSSASNPNIPNGCSVNAAQCAGQCSASSYKFVSCNTPCQ